MQTLRPMPIHSFNGSNAAQSTVFAKVIETHGAMDYCGSAGRIYRSAAFLVACADRSGRDGSAIIPG